VHVHLAFVGAGFAQCGATVNQRNPSTAIVAEATCPDCVDELRSSEQVNAAMHSGAGRAMRPDYER
jgi:hypothetical protein